ncbi:DUF6148 family protein [Mesobacillus thioparans]|uniref:DUF6148 family protein n=1 Tax=Mesobacillus thioparans TaxID=370439 RepID=UPI0039EF7EEE
MSTRIERLKERLELYYEAEMAILTSQEYSMNGRTLKRADLGEVRKAISELERQIKAQGGRRNVFRAIPID